MQHASCVDATSEVIFMSIEDVREPGGAAQVIVRDFQPERGVVIQESRVVR